MELRHLRYFLKVSQELNFRKAADKLFISQPPLSRQIKELEEELGVSLFDRSNKKVQLTPAGLHLKEKVEQIFNTLEHIQVTLPLMNQGYAGYLKIGYISSFLQDRLIQIISDLNKSYPQINTRLYEMITQDQIEAIEKGNLDIGVVRQPEFSSSTITIPLYQEPLCLIFPNHHRLIHEKKLNLVHFKNDPFIFFNKDQAKSFYEDIVRICSEYNFFPDIAHEANNMHSILQMVENGLGISIVPESARIQFGTDRLKFFYIKGYQSKVYLAYHRENKKPIVQQFIIAAKTIFKI